MAFKKQWLSIEVIYDDELTAEPVKWNWNDLLDMAGDEYVEILEADPPADMEDYPDPEDIDNSPV